MHAVDPFGPSGSEKEQVEVGAMGGCFWLEIPATWESRVETCPLGKLIRKLSFGTNSVFSLITVASGE